MEGFVFFLFDGIESWAAWRKRAQLSESSFSFLVPRASRCTIFLKYAHLPYFLICSHSIPFYVSEKMSGKCTIYIQIRSRHASRELLAAARMNKITVLDFFDGTSHRAHWAFPRFSGLLAHCGEQQESNSAASKFGLRRRVGITVVRKAPFLTPHHEMRSHQLIKILTADTFAYE